MSNQAVLKEFVSAMGAPAGVLSISCAPPQEPSLVSDLKRYVSPRLAHYATKPRKLPDGSLAQAYISHWAKARSEGGLALDLGGLENIIRVALEAGDSEYPIFTYDVGNGLRRCVLVNGELLPQTRYQMADTVRSLSKVYRAEAGTDKAESAATTLITHLNYLASLGLGAKISNTSPIEQQAVQVLDWLAGSLVSMDGIDAMPRNGLYLLLDFDRVMSGSQACVEVQRRVKNLADSLRREFRKLVLVGDDCVPHTCAGLVPAFKLGMPEPSEIEAVIRQVIDTLKAQAERVGRAVNVELDDLSGVVKAAQGLPLEHIEAMVRSHIAGPMTGTKESGVVDHTLEAAIRQEKSRRLQVSGLEVVPLPNTIPGGLGNLKAWAKQAKEMFWLHENPEKAELFAHLSPQRPRGALIAGISGTGKTLFAQTLGASWGVPILRLDIGSLFGSLVGQSEKQTRNILAAVEANAPCILFIDEIDKGLASAIGSNNDSGTSSRVLATLLTWLNDHDSAVFTVASANDLRQIQASKPELLRSGRWDAMFFVDVPTADERLEILESHLSKKTQLKKAEYQSLVTATESFTGAEIAATVKAAVYAAVAENRPKLTAQDVLKATQNIRPLALSNPQQVQALRDWGYTHAIPASTGQVTPVHPEMVGYTSNSTQDIQTML